MDFAKLTPMRREPVWRHEPKTQDVDCPHERSHRLWAVCRYGYAGDVCSGKSTSRVRSGVRRILRLRFDLWVPSRGVAFRSDRSNLVIDCDTPLVVEEI